MDEEMPDEPGLPKTSTQFFQKTSQSFQLFLTRIRETLAEPSFKDGEYGYRVGEEP